MKDEIIKIPHTIHSRNILDKKHWAWKSSLKKEYQLLIRNQMKLNHISKANGHQKYYLSITNYRKRLLDYDNLVGGCKGLIDALWYEGFVFDDAVKYIGTPKIKQMKIKKNEEPYISVRRRLIEL